MSDIFSVLQSSFTSNASSSLFAPGSKFAKVDPTLWQGTWTGTDSSRKPYTISISNVQGYRAEVTYRGSQGSQNARVFITNQSAFLIGNSKFVLTAQGKATFASVVTNPFNGAQTVEQSTATQQT
jgi:hypothetical protein